MRKKYQIYIVNIYIKNQFHNIIYKIEENIKFTNNLYNIY